MKTIIITILIAFNFTLTFGQYAEQNEISSVVLKDSISKSELYKSAKDLLLSTFMTADNLVEFDDQNMETIFITGHLKMAEMKYMEGAMGYFINTDENTLTFKLKLEFRDGRFKYTISNIRYSFIKIGGPKQREFVQDLLIDFKEMPKKKILLVKEEANSLLTTLVYEIENKIGEQKKDDW